MCIVHETDIRSVVAFSTRVRVIDTVDELLKWRKIETFYSAYEVVCRSLRHMLYVATTESGEPLVEWSLRTGPQGELIAAVGAVGTARDSRDALWIAAGEWLSVNWHFAPPASLVALTPRSPQQVSMEELLAKAKAGASATDGH